MIKKKIFVGVEYEDAFHSIYTLIEGKCFDGLPYSVADGVISDGTYEYELTDQRREISEQVKFAFEKDGATWFKALRGEKVPDDDAVWNTFRSNIVIEYHKRFSIVEYRNHAPTAEEKEKAVKTATRSMRRFCKVFYPDFQDLVEVTLRNDELFDDIYGVAMKIDLSGGTGASLPVLGKVYFNRKGKVMIPLAKDIAAGIDKSINAVIPNDDVADQIPTDTAVLDNALDSMQALIEDSNRNFADYIHFGNKSDKKAVEGMLEKMSHDAVELECQRVDVLYVTHIQTNAYEFTAYAQGKPMCNVRLGINDALSISCANCEDDGWIVDRNQIRYADGQGNPQTANLDFSRDDLGLKPQALERIKETGTQKKHFIPVSCKELPGKKTCAVFKCESQLFEVFDGKKNVRICKDCPYPEVVYTTASGDKRYTPMLSFAFDKMELVSPQSVGRIGTCELCGRNFSGGAMRNGKCPLCAKAEVEVDDDAKALYASYKSFLAPFQRKGKGAKGCFEDDEIIVFAVGRKRYVFNKLSVKDVGYVEQPRRIR